MTEDNTENCGGCRYWAPIAATRGFVGKCGHPERPNERSTDKVDVCRLFKPTAAKGAVIEEYLT